MSFNIVYIPSASESRPDFVYNYFGKPATYRTPLLAQLQITKLKNIKPREFEPQTLGKYQIVEVRHAS